MDYKSKTKDYILFLPLFMPLFFVKFTMLSVLYFVAMSAEFLWLFSYYFRKKSTKIDTVFILLIVYQSIFIATTILYNGDVQKCLFNSLNIITLFLLCKDYFIKDKVHIMLLTIQNIFSLYLMINLFTIFMFPGGILDKMYFLGYRTRITEYAFVLVCIALLNYSINKRRVGLILSLTVATLSILNQWIATAIIGILILLIMYKIDIIVAKLRYLTYKKFYLLSLIITYLIVILQIQYVFSWLIEGVLHRSLTLTYRTYLWANVWDAIQEKIFFGHGIIMQNGEFVWNGWGYTQAHNQILQSLYDGGIINTAILLLIMYLCGNKLKLLDKKQYIVSISIFVYMIMMITEIYMYYQPSFVLFFIAYFIVNKIKNTNQLNTIQTRKV